MVRNTRTEWILLGSLNVKVTGKPGSVLPPRCAPSPSEQQDRKQQHSPAEHHTHNSLYLISTRLHNINNINTINSVNNTADSEVTVEHQACLTVFHQVSVSLGLSKSTEQRRNNEGQQRRRVQMWGGQRSARRSGYQSQAVLAPCRQAGIIRLLCAYTSSSEPCAESDSHYSTCTPPLQFAYVQFGGCDWPILSRWMPVQMSLTEVNMILQKAWIMYAVRPQCDIK